MSDTNVLRSSITYKIDSLASSVLQFLSATLEPGWQIGNSEIR
jgi:hypothetical protein